MNPAPVVQIVDDDPDLRRSLQRLLAAHQLPTTAHPDGDSFLEHLDPDQPGCALVDMRMPGRNGLQVLRALRERRIPLPVIILTGHGDVPMAVQAVKDGAFDFLEKPFDPELLLIRIRDALTRDGVNRQNLELRQEFERRLDLLTAREREIFELVVQGWSSAQIAQELFRSEKTVKLHRARVMNKMGASSASDLVRMTLAARRFADDDQ